MEIILMGVLTIIAMLIGIYIGDSKTIDQFSQRSYDQGYQDGLLVGQATVEIDFPTTLDGKFYSREAAIRQMSRKEGDN